LFNVRKLLLLANQTQVHAEETRGAGMEVAQNYTKEPEMPPVTFVGSLCKIHALLFSKIADAHDVRTWKFVSFRKIFRFSLHNTRDVTRGQEGTIPRAPNHCGGPKKFQQCHGHFFSKQHICYRKTSGSNMEWQTFFLLRAPSNLVTPLHIMIV